MQERPYAVDDARVVARQPLQREQRGSAARRAVVLETTAEELDLLPVPELRDRAKRDCALAIVPRPRGGLELVVPLLPQDCKLALVSVLRERVGVRRRVRKGGHAPTDSRGRAAGPM